ncbi:hypothetical protein [Apilactobacillus apinorum]|nr:hypothetical protein [Apilactobacillus apinorum]KOY69045.1 hypothetical protein RZ74_08470 [Apilactobacillus apinorum]CAI2681051.1 Hypothetical protein AAPFHON13_08980 [Apilactobacillus apinorum]
MMELFLEILFGFIIAVVGYNVIHYFFITKPKDAGKSETISVLNDLMESAGKKSKIKIFKINDLSEIWERNIYVFEYVIESDNQLVRTITDEIDLINKSGRWNHKIVMTDYYIRDNYIHIDLAYLLNLATYEYVLDMEKLKDVN